MLYEAQLLSQGQGDTDIFCYQQEKTKGSYLQNRQSFSNKLYWPLKGFPYHCTVLQQTLKFLRISLSLYCTANIKIH